MKLANVIIPAKEFLFDTWYGALTVWCGASALLVAMLLLDLPFANAEDATELRLYVSDISTDCRFWTFLQDPPYRISLATENVGYNQPPQPGFYFGHDLKSHGIVFRGMKLP